MPLLVEPLAARVQAILQHNGCGQDSELSLVICDDSFIAGLNEQYLGRTGPTNVLAFAMTEGEGADLTPGLLGDVVVSTDTALTEAAANNLDGPEHFMRLVIHGILHLLGYDHEQGGPEAVRMETKTEELLRATSQMPLTG